MIYFKNTDGSLVVHDNRDIVRLLKMLSDAPLTARFIPAPEGDERVLMLEEDFSRLAAILSSRGDYPRVSEDQLFELSFGELMVLIDDYLTGVPADTDMLLRRYSDAFAAARCLAGILMRLEPLESSMQLSPDEMLPYCTLAGWRAAFGAICTPVAGVLYDYHFGEVYRLLADTAEELSDAPLLTLNSILHIIPNYLVDDAQENNRGLLLTLHLLVWPMVLYEKNNRGVTADQVRKKLIG